ncbi:Mitochondrial intermediate peptidase [Xylographa carneopallida]|nr:Mitochondrial intermediate peptidase [Xylographa carneopallida]
MSKSLQQPWTCLQCIRRQRSTRRYLATAAAAATITHSPPSYTRNHNPPLTAHDDRDLRKIFDSRPFWHEFSKSRTGFYKQNVGLFQNQYLTRPEGFKEYARVTLVKCRRIVAKVLEISTVDGYKSIVQDLDRLSDLLCRIIDLADFVRTTHPDPAFQNAANAAHALMFQYMNTLNTTTGLNDQLERALANSEVTSSWTEEEKTVAQLLKKDFSQSAIDLPRAKREKFVELSSTISVLGSKFVDEMRPARMSLAIESGRLKGMNPMLLKQLQNRRGHVILPIVGFAAQNAIRYVQDEATRKEIYIASRTAADGQVQVLEALLKHRAELAKLSGFSSYARMTLIDKMAQSPEAVNKFLSALSADNAPRMQAELKRMLTLKYPSSSGVSGNLSGSTVINAWDRDCYRQQLFAKPTPSSRKPDFLPAYFSLGTVMQGLSRLFSRLYGVRFVPREPAPGETWNPDVRRLDVIDEAEGHIAVVYCDLFARDGKNPNPAHFTLRCSRLISGSELAEDPSSSSPLHNLSTAQLANDGMATSHPVDPSGSVYQLPTIALICDFPSPPPSNSTSSSQPPTLLPLPSLLTLFHEMGHAIHSILGRTRLQNVSGTRCATDFAELPSVLMERFATDPAVLALFARHWETDAPLPYAIVAAGLASERRAEASDTETQVLLAAVDQAYHSESVLRDDGGAAFDSTAVWHALSARWASVPEAPGTRWQGFFGHLVGYGGSYYAYLFDRAIAAKVWEGVFRGGREGQAVERANGERFRSEVLRWGGSRNGWRCVGGLLGEEGRGLEEGGERAMEEVGRWGISGEGR